VPKRVRANHFGWNASQPGIVPDTVSYGRAGYGLVGHVLAQEEGLDRSDRRPFPSQVGRQRFCNCWQQRELNRHLGLWPADFQYAGMPVQVLQSNRKYFGCAQTIKPPAAT